MSLPRAVSVRWGPRYHCPGGGKRLWDLLNHLASGVGFRLGEDSVPAGIFWLSCCGCCCRHCICSVRNGSTADAPPLVARGTWVVVRSERPEGFVHQVLISKADAAKVGEPAPQNLRQLQYNAIQYNTMQYVTPSPSYKYNLQYNTMRVGDARRRRPRL